MTPYKLKKIDNILNDISKGFELYNTKDIVSKNYDVSQLNESLDKLLAQVDNLNYMVFKIICEHIVKAVKTGSIEFVEAMLEFGEKIRIDIRDKNNNLYEQPLLTAIRDKNHPIIELILSKEHNFTNSNWINICMQACQSDIKTFAVLSFNGMEVPNIEQAITITMYNKKEDIAQCLITAYEPSEKDLERYVMHCSSYGLKSLLTYLVEEKNVTISQEVLQTLVICAHTEILEYLLTKETSLKDIEETIIQYRETDEKMNKWLHMQQLTKQLNNSSKVVAKRKI